MVAGLTVTTEKEIQSILFSIPDKFSYVYMTVVIHFHVQVVRPELWGNNS